MKYLAAFALFLAPVAALASPAPEYACYDREFSARIYFDEGWSTALMKNNWGEFELNETGGQGGPEGAFSFSDATYSFEGIAPEGVVKTGETVLGRCFQTAESIKEMALYGSPENRGRWSTYDVMGEGFQTVRAAPSVLSDKIDTLEAGEPVRILENTDQFLDGYFWFKIEYFEGSTGYIWGALLCSDTDDPELNQTVRRCR
jgi:hypothetical protein